MIAYDFQLLLKHLLEHGFSWAPNQEILYRDQYRYTYADMVQRVLKLASALHGLGVRKGTKVGVIEWDSHRYLEMYFAIPGIGAILHTINPNLAAENVIYTIQHAEDEILIFHEDFLPLAEQVRERIKSLRGYILIRDRKDQPDIDWVHAEYEAFIAASARLTELPDFDERTQATLSYTTGTTGSPKGVYFSHRQLVLQTYAGWGSMAIFGNYGGIHKHDVYMPLTPLFHVHGWGWPYVATAFGLKQVYPGKYDYELILRLVAEQGVTLSHCVPTILQRVITQPSAKGLDLTGWTLVRATAVSAAGPACPPPGPPHLLVVPAPRFPGFPFGPYLPASSPAIDISLTTLAFLGLYLCQGGSHGSMSHHLKKDRPSGRAGGHFGPGGRGPARYGAGRRQRR